MSSESMDNICVGLPLFSPVKHINKILSHTLSARAKADCKTAISGENSITGHTV